MKQEEKDLLFKDICARLPYKVKVSYYDNETERQECDIVDSIYEDAQEIGVGQWCLKMDKLKPYLFPMSSMTEEQKEVYCQLQQKVIYNSKGLVTEDVMNYVNWCYENHLDINDLIPKDLAIDATGLNIY